MFENLKKFIKNLQAADEARKKRWLFVLSAVAMIVVVGVWGLYIKKSIPSLGVSEAIKESSKESSWQVFQKGLETIISQIKNLIKTGREISITPPQP